MHMPDPAAPRCSLKGLARLWPAGQPSGKSVRFDMWTSSAFRMTLTLAPHMPYGFIVEDPAGETPWQEIQAYVLDQLGIPRFEDERPQNNGPRDGASHRPSGRAVVRDAEAAVAVPREGAAVPSLHVLDADDALRAKVPDLVWHVAEWIPGNNVTLLGGNGGEGKSLLALQLAHVTRCGMPFFGRSVRAGAAIFYSAEETEDELTACASRNPCCWAANEDPLKLISMADKPALMATSNWQCRRDEIHHAAGS
jgi:hypothetical protein